MGRIPVASGSSVPPWPAFIALKARRTAATAPAEDRPSGLSRTSQPSTLSPLRVLAIEVALHIGCAQGRVNAAGIVERRIGNETELRCAAQLHRLGDLSAQ